MMTGGKIIGVYEDDELNGAIKMDIEHYFTETGNGEPLILLHGNGEDCGYFQGQIEEFSSLYHVYAIDTGSSVFTQLNSSLYGFIGQI